MTPPFAAYLSGHSTFSAAGAEVLTQFTGDAYFPGGLGTFTAPDVCRATIKTTRLDDWANHHDLQRLDLMKIDVEGAEALAREAIEIFSRVLSADHWRTRDAESTLGAALVALAVLTEPVGATLLAWALFDETPHRFELVGGSLLLLGLGVAVTGHRPTIDANRSDPARPSATVSREA